MALLVVQDVYNYKYIVDVNKYRTYRETDDAYYLYIENKTIRVTKRELMHVLGHRLALKFKKDHYNADAQNGSRHRDNRSSRTW